MISHFSGYTLELPQGALVESHCSKTMQLCHTIVDSEAGILNPEFESCSQDLVF